VPLFHRQLYALTSIQDRAELDEITLHVATAYLAFGIDPGRSVFFCQSDVPQVTELCWMLNCVCPVSQMEKAMSYSSIIRCSRRPTSLSTTPSLCPSVRTRSSTSRSPATWPGDVQELR